MIRKLSITMLFVSAMIWGLAGPASHVFAAGDSDNLEGDQTVMVGMSASHVKFLGVDPVKKHTGFTVVNQIKNPTKKPLSNFLPAIVEVEWSESGHVLKVILLKKFDGEYAE